MTEADLNQIRVIVTDTTMASEERMTAAIMASEERMGRTVADSISASEERMSEGLTRAVVELDRRITDLEARTIERQDAAQQRTFDRMVELNRQIETNLLTSFHGYAKGPTARLHSLEN
jgi:hypothetical protein